MPRKVVLQTRRKWCTAGGGCVSSQTLCQHPPQTDGRCLMWGNLWIMDFHNRPLMIFPSLKSALQSFSASTLSFNWKKIYYSFPPSRDVLSIWVAQAPHLDSLHVPRLLSGTRPFLDTGPRDQGLFLASPVKGKVAVLTRKHIEVVPTHERI